MMYSLPLDGEMLEPVPHSIQGGGDNSHSGDTIIHNPNR